MSANDHLVDYQGQIVSQSYNAGFAVLSCLVSFVGAASTLELINRRTGFRGLFNNLLLVSSAVTMGGVAIWSMHFIANRATDLASGEPQMQISYSPGFTVLSFFVPIIVLLAAFIAIGSNDNISWWRVSIGGIICGGAVCGMHYLGNASIANYHCIYHVANVAGSAVIAVAASTVALSMFFVFRAMWANTLWKRIISAVILASAVCGMHWCAALGTKYRFISAEQAGNGPSRNAPVIVVICLAIGACLVIASSFILKARSMSRSARKAQQITLAAAFFDNHGRLLVDTNGLMPSVVVTDSFLEKNNKHGYSISHPLFHWMFQATRNWSGILSMTDGMKAHLSQLPHSGGDRNDRLGVDLTNNLGERIENYDVVFRELFCVAALSLAELLREQLTSVGVLWDEILPTGINGKQPEPQLAQCRNDEQAAAKKQTFVPSDTANSLVDLAEKGVDQRQQKYGGGSLMFLVRRVGNERDVDRLASAGYRFAELRQVCGLIRSGMQIRSPDFESKLREMATYADQPSQPRPRVSLGLFGIKPRADISGFDVLVQKGARNLLPSTTMPMDKLEAWHLEFLKRFENMSVSRILQALVEPAAANVNPREKIFAGQLRNIMEDLRKNVQDPLFNEAVLTATPVNVPCLDLTGVETTTKLLAFRLLIPTHSVMSVPGCEFIPLSFFKVRQLTQKQQLDFMQGVHRELGPIVKNLSDPTVGREKQEWRRWSRLWRGVRSELTRAEDSGVEADGKIIPTVSARPVSSSSESLHTNSTVGLCPPGSGRSGSLRSEDTTTEPRANTPVMTGAAQPYSGILVSQEITVDEEAIDPMDDETYGYPGRLSTPGQSSGMKGMTGTGRKASSTLGIEMRPMGNVVMGTNVRAAQAHVIGGRDTDLGRAATFVDVLFAQCVMGHDAGR